MSIDCPSDDFLTLRLRQAVTNSHKKQYHGWHSNVPSIGTQLGEIWTKKPNTFTYYDENSKTFTDASDPCWQKACLEKYPWIQRALQKHWKQPSAAKLAKFADDRAIENNCTSADALRQMLKSDFHGSHHVDAFRALEAVPDYPNDFTWRDLFLKLFFEEFLTHFSDYYGNKNPMKNLHLHVNALASVLTVVRIPIIQKRLKSKNYWLLVVLGKLTKLRVIKFHLDGNDLNIQKDFFKFMNKGLAYNASNGGKVEKIKFYNVLGP